MKYITTYESPLGIIIMAGTDRALTALDFAGQLYQPEFGDDYKRKETPVFKAAKAWLDEYFSGKEPQTDVPVELHGTSFRQEVWSGLQKIPYGKTTTYGAIAAQISARTGKPMSAQAVGGAVGHNPISLIVPCHRVIGSDRSLTGYAGGLDKKRYLLDLEGILYKK